MSAQRPQNDFYQAELFDPEKPGHNDADIPVASTIETPGPGNPSSYVQNYNISGNGDNYVPPPAPYITPPVTPQNGYGNYGRLQPDGSAPAAAYYDQLQTANQARSQGFFIGVAIFILFGIVNLLLYKNASIAILFFALAGVFACCGVCRYMSQRNENQQLMNSQGSANQNDLVAYNSAQIPRAQPTQQFL